MSFRKVPHKVAPKACPAVFHEEVRTVIPDDNGIHNVIFKSVSSDEIISQNLDTEVINPHSLISSGQSIPVPDNFNVDTTDPADVADMAGDLAIKELDKVNEVKEDIKTE